MMILLISTGPNRLIKEMKARYGTDVDILDLSTHQISRSQVLSSIADMVTATHYDLLVTYRCPFIIPHYIREKPALCINIHPLDLPEFAGLNPWQKFLQTGRKSAHAVAHVMSDLPDSGTILAQWEYTFISPFRAREAADITVAENAPALFNDYMKNESTFSHSIESNIKK